MYDVEAISCENATTEGSRLWVGWVKVDGVKYAVQTRVGEFGISIDPQPMDRNIQSAIINAVWNTPEYRAMAQQIVKH